MAFRENLIKLREQAGFRTANSLADALNLPRSTYATYESPSKPREPKFDTLCKIAGALHVTTDELLDAEYNQFQQCLLFAREAGWNIDEHPEGVIVHVNLRDLGFKPEESSPFEDFYTMHPNGIIPTFLQKEEFISICKGAKEETERIISRIIARPRIALSRNQLAIAFLIRIRQIVENPNPTERSTNHE